MLSGICRFVGLVFCDFSGNFFQNAFQTYICGLILGPCFCRNPFLWRAIDFRFFLSRFRYLLWILEFLLFLLLCFFVCLLCCFSCFYVFLLLCLFVFPAFPLFCFFLFFCFSAFLASLFSASLFFCFLFFLLRCFLLLILCLSISTCFFLQSCVFMIFPRRTKIRKSFLYFVLPLVELNCASICNKQIPRLTNSDIYGNLLMTGLILASTIPENPYLGFFEGFGGVISKFLSAYDPSVTMYIYIYIYITQPLQSFPACGKLSQALIHQR